MAEPLQPKFEDGSKAHLRTYAKDVAQLTGKPLPKEAVNVPAPAPAPLPEPSVTAIPAPSTPAPIVAPTEDPLPAVTLPPDPQKEAALERLRAKVAPQAAPVPTPVVQSPSPIHTYKSDFAEHIQEQKASPLSVLAAQQDASAAPVILKEKKPFPTQLVGGFLLILIGISAITAAVLYASRDRVVEELFVPSLVFADERASLVGSAEELRAQLAAPEKAGELPPGGVLVTYITYSTTSPDGKTTIELAASGKDLIDALRLPAPDILLRNILPQSTVGVVRAGQETRPFFILKVESYERTYAGMLTWEASMERDLADFYPAYPVDQTATTTLPSFRLSFVDDTVENRDVRILKDADNRTLILYGYRDKDTLIIARDEAAFAELVARLAATRAQ